jgi:hypothetical protein
MTIQKPEVRESLAAFVDAAIALDRMWALDDNDELDRGYPPCLPSFDEFLPQLIAWRDAPRRTPEEFAHEVIALLGARRVGASWEYPGFIAIDVCIVLGLVIHVSHEGTWGASLTTDDDNALPDGIGQWSHEFAADVTPQIVADVLRAARDTVASETRALLRRTTSAVASLVDGADRVRAPRMVTAKAVIVELHTSAGRVPAYSMLDGPDAGVSFIASDTRAARLRMGEDVNATYCPGDQFARLAPEEH